MGDLPRWKIGKMWSGLIVMGDLPRWRIEKIWSGLIVMGDLPGWKMRKIWSGLIIMGDLPMWRIEKNVKWSHCYGWPTQMEDRKTVKWSHCYGWPTQMEDVMWQVWKMGLTWRSPEGMIEEGPENLVLLDNSWSQGLKTRCFLIARLIFSFLWDFPNSKVYLIFFPFQGHNHDSLLLSTQWFFLCPQSCWTSLRIFL
jgi:hypothetical protein